MASPVIRRRIAVRDATTAMPRSLLLGPHRRDLTVEAAHLGVRAPPSLRTFCEVHHDHGGAPATIRGTVRTDYARRIEDLTTSLSEVVIDFAFSR